MKNGSDLRIFSIGLLVRHALIFAVGADMPKSLDVGACKDLPCPPNSGLYAGMFLAHR